MLFQDAITPENMFDYTYSKPLQPGFWEGKFPSVVISGKDYEFSQDEIDSEVTMARFHPFNAETDIDQRIGMKVSKATLGYLKRKRTIEEEAMLLLAESNKDESIRRAIQLSYNDSDAMIRSILTRVEQMRAEVVTTGKLVINENGYSDEYNFNIPDENKKTFDWTSPDADIIGDIENLCDLIENNGQDTRPSYMVVSTKTIRLLLNNEKIRQSIFGVNAGMPPNQVQLNDLMEKQGLPRLVKYNLTAKFADADNIGYVKKRLMPENEVLFIPEGPLGNTVWGTTPEEVNAFVSGQQLTKRNNIVLQITGKHDTESMEVKASARAFVTLSVPKRIGIGTISGL